MPGHGGGVGPRLQVYQDGIDDMGVRGQRRGEIGRHRGGEAFLAAQRSGQPGPLGAHLLVVFLVRHFLGVRQRQEHQGVTVGIDGTLGQAHHRVGMEAQSYLVAELHAQFLVSHHFIMGLPQAPAGHQPLRAAQPGGDVVTDDAEMPALIADLAFHRVINKRTGLLHPGNRLNAVMVVLGHGGLLVEGAAPEALHHPEVGVGGLDDGQAFVDITPVEAVHGQDDGEKQPHPENGGDEAPLVELQVIDG